MSSFHLRGIKNFRPLSRNLQRWMRPSRPSTAVCQLPVMDGKRVLRRQRARGAQDSRLMSRAHPRRFPPDYGSRRGEDGRRGEGTEPTSVMSADVAPTARMSDGGRAERAGSQVNFSRHGSLCRYSEYEKAALETTSVTKTGVKC